uniref:Kinetochore scaffold 1 n=1 Tax=Leptobrachium leishanense TaxID=445787 RepID=A0A8C5MIS9_9ANUR
MDGQVFQGEESDQVDPQGPRISSILKASRSPLKTLASGNTRHQDTTIDKRSKRSRRVSFAETISVFSLDLQSAGSAEHEDCGADPKRSDQENEEPTGTMCGIAGMDTLLHAPIQITGHETECGYSVASGERTLPCENEMDMTASNNVFIDNPQSTHRTDVTSFLASLKPQSGEDPSKAAGCASSAYVPNFPSFPSSVDASVEAKRFIDFLATLKTGKEAKSMDVSSDKGNIFPDAHLLAGPSVENKAPSCGKVFSFPLLHADTGGDQSKNWDRMFSSSEKSQTNSMLQPKINFSDFLSSLKIGKDAAKCPEVDKRSVLPGMFLPGDISKKNQASHCREMLSLAPAHEDTGNVTRIFKEQDNMELTRCHTTAITALIPESSGHFTEKLSRPPLMDRTMGIEDDMDMTRSHTVNIGVRGLGPSRANTIAFNGGDLFPSNKTIMFNNSDVMELTKVNTVQDCSLAFALEKPVVPRPAIISKTLSRLALATALRDNTTPFACDQDMEFTKSHTVAINFNDSQVQRTANALKQMENIFGNLDEANGNSTRIVNRFSLHETRRQQDDLERTEVGLEENTLVLAGVTANTNVKEKTLFFSHDQADMDITRSHTVVIDRKTLNQPSQEKSKATDQEVGSEPASMAKTSTASGASDHDLARRNTAHAGTSDYGQSLHSSLVRGVKGGRDMSSADDEGMEFTKSHTVFIEAPLTETREKERLPPNKEQSFSLNNTLSQLPQDKTILFPLDKNDMDITQAATVRIETRALSTNTKADGMMQRKSVGAGLHSRSLSNRTVLCEDDMELTKYHTMVNVRDPIGPTGQCMSFKAACASTVQAKLDFTRNLMADAASGVSKMYFKRERMSVPHSASCSNSTIGMDETCMDDRMMTSKRMIQYGEKEHAASRASQDKTLVFSPDADYMDMTRSHTVAIENRILGTVMQIEKADATVVSNDITTSFPRVVSQNVTRGEDDMEITKSHTMIIAMKDPSKPTGQYMSTTATNVQNLLDFRSSMNFTHNLTDDASSGNHEQSFKRKNMLVSCPNSTTVMDETCMNDTKMTSKPMLQYGEIGLAASRASQEKTLLFTTGTDHMDITRSHTVAIENRILGTVMQLEQADITDVSNDFTACVDQTVSGGEDDIEIPKSHNVVDDGLREMDLSFANRYVERTLYGQDDMELTQSNTVFIDGACSSKQGSYFFYKPPRKSVCGSEDVRMPNDHTVYVGDDMDITTANTAVVNEPRKTAASWEKSVFLSPADGMDLTQSDTVFITKTDKVIAGRNPEMKSSSIKKSGFQEDGMGLLMDNPEISKPRVLPLVSDHNGFNASEPVQQTTAWKEKPEQSLHVQLPQSVDETEFQRTLTKKSNLEDEVFAEDLNVSMKPARLKNTVCERFPNDLACSLLPRALQNTSANDQPEEETHCVPGGFLNECTGSLAKDTKSATSHDPAKRKRPKSKRVSFMLPESRGDICKTEVPSAATTAITTVQGGDLRVNLVGEHQHVGESSSCSNTEFVQAYQQVSCSTTEEHLISRSCNRLPDVTSDKLLPGAALSRRSALCSVPGSVPLIHRSEASCRNMSNLHLKIESLMQSLSVPKYQSVPGNEPVVSSEQAMADKGSGSEHSGKEPIGDATSLKADVFRTESCLPHRLSVKIFQPKLPNRRGCRVSNAAENPSAQETHRKLSVQTSLAHLRALTNTADHHSIDAEMLPMYADDQEPNLSFQVPEGAWEALCEGENRLSGPNQHLLQPEETKKGQKRTRETEGTFHKEKKSKQSDDTKCTKDFSTFKSLGDGSSSECSLLQSTKSSEPDSCSSSSSMDSRVEMSQQYSQMVSEATCGKSFWQKLQDGTITVKEFFSLLGIRTLIQRPRYSEAPTNRRTNDDRNPISALLDQHIFQPKLKVYEEESLAMCQTIEELKSRTDDQDKPLAALNGVLWEAMRMCSEEEVMGFGRKLKSMKILYAKKTKLIGHKGKVSLYSKLMLNAEDNQKKLQSTISDIDKFLDEVEDTIAGLEDETAKLKAECQSGKFTHKDPEVTALQEQYENLKLQEVNDMRKISDLEDCKLRALTLVGDLQEKERYYAQRLDEMEYPEWDLEKWTDNQAVFSFLYDSYELAITFGDPVDGVTFNNQPCRRISAIEFSTMLDDDTAPPSTLLVHRLVTLFNINRDNPTDVCETQQELPRFLSDTSLVVSRCKLLGEEIEYLMKWGGRYNVLKTEVQRTEVSLLFSALATLSKFKVVVNVTESYPMLPLTFTFQNLIGQVSPVVCSSSMVVYIDGRLPSPPFSLPVTCGSVDGVGSLQERGFCRA